MKSSHTLKALVLAIALICSVCRTARAESQDQEYKGITDPFGDPSNYEFADDEKEDKEFFHLGRFLMMGLDLGAAIFTGGLGRSTEPGFYVGAHLQYFFDKSICLELGAHYSNHLDQPRPTATTGADLNVNMIPLNVGFRYYFDVQSAPKAIAMANPYLSLGGGIYMRSISQIDATAGFTAQTGSTTNFGGYGGGGVEFNIYHRHIYLGLDLRYHLVFFSDANSTWNGQLNPGDRSGDYFTTSGTITYNF